jgi:hypothetical protein
MTSFLKRARDGLDKYVASGKLSRDITGLVLALLPWVLLAHWKPVRDIGWAWVIPVLIYGAAGHLLQRAERVAYRDARFDALMLAESGFDPSPKWYREGPDLGQECGLKTCEACGDETETFALWSEGGTPPETLLSAWLCSDCAITERRLRNRTRVADVEAFLQRITARGSRS